MLLDPEIALPHVLERARFRPTPACSSRSSEAASVRAPGGLRAAELLPDVGARGVRRLGGTAAKLLVRLRADREDTGGANAALIRAAAADCAAATCCSSSRCWCTGPTTRTPRPSPLAAPA